MQNLNRASHFQPGNGACIGEMSLIIKTGAPHRVNVLVWQRLHRGMVAGLMASVCRLLGRNVAFGLRDTGKRHDMLSVAAIPVGVRCLNLAGPTSLLSDRLATQKQICSFLPLAM